MKVTSAAVRSRVVFLLRSGHSTRAVAAQVGISRATVARIGKKECSDRSTCRPGRPRALSEHDRRQIARRVMTGETTTAVQAQLRFEASTGIHVSAQTIRNVLRRSGLMARVAPKKPLLSLKHRRQRLEFARKYQHWTIDDWRRVIWSDETKINLFGSDGPRYCWRKSGAQLQQHHIRPTVKHGGGSLMMWGCMTLQGVGYACQIQGRLNAELYCNILADEFLGTLEWYGLQPENIVFQHDNDPKHTAHSTKQWLRENGIQVLDWPAQSPDLNPIENLWYYLKQQLLTYDKPCRGIHELWERVEREWEAIPPELCARLVESMPKRIASVLRAKGGYTRW
jgi:transposase